MTVTRNAQIWAPGYLKHSVRRITTDRSTPLKRIWVAIADHYEPMCGRASLKSAQSRVELWRSAWPVISRRCRPDAAGNRPKYTFFYPEEEYHPTLVGPLAEMVHTGTCDVEIHLHHDGEGRENFINRIVTFCKVLHDEHGLLRKHKGKLTFGFVHGNWALDNSRPDGRWCGLTGEIKILADLGCYADFTMPSGDSPTQARVINTIYWCTGNTDRPKSYDDGVAVTRGGGIEGDLLMIPGPFGIRWRDRALPRLETGELAGYDLATPYRVKRWVDLSPRVGADAFIKLYTHGAQERNSSALLNDGLATAFDLLVDEAKHRKCELYFVSAWQMYLAIDAIRQELNPVAASTQSS
jgi:hypothetical protein